MGLTQKIINDLIDILIDQKRYLIKNIFQKIQIKIINFMDSTTSYFFI